MTINTTNSQGRNALRRAPGGFELGLCRDAIIAGSLLGDLSLVARELCRALQYNPITVWMNADAEVLYQPAGTAPEVTPGWIAGTYGFGVSTADIEDDLVLLKAERRATGMLDD
jgi:hypothetical protein